MNNIGIAALVAMGAALDPRGVVTRDAPLGPPLPPGKGRVPVKKLKPRRGAGSCEDCGKTISANKSKCFACSQAVSDRPHTPDAQTSGVVANKSESEEVQGEKEKA